MNDALSHDQVFCLEEYKSLRKEIEVYLAESRSQERYTLIAVGAIWAWLVGTGKVNGLLWSAPIMLTVATSIRMVAILRHFRHLGAYIKKLEAKFGVSGWEHEVKGRTLGVAYMLLSAVLFILSVVAFCYRDVIAVGK